MNYQIMSDKTLFLIVTLPLQIYGLLTTNPVGFGLALQIDTAAFRAI